MTNEEVVAILVDAVSEIERLRAENAELKENASATLYHEALRLKRENAELREALRRIVGHLEYEAKQGDGIADDAYDDYFAAKSLLGQKGMPNAAARGLAAIRLELASTKPGAGT